MGIFLSQSCVSGRKSGGRIIELLEAVRQDTKQTLAVLEQTEKDTIAEFQALSERHDEALANLKKTLTEHVVTESRYKAEEENKTQERKSSKTEVKELNQEKDILHKECDSILKSFKKRSDTRTSEIEGLEAVVRILSGGNE